MDSDGCLIKPTSETINGKLKSYRTSADPALGHFSEIRQKDPAKSFESNLKTGKPLSSLQI